uniref:MATH domain-containing protein n=1 Tax=Glossina austeni TaxID=7395 RepID=A0A1A9VSK9_GLOAU
MAWLPAINTSVGESWGQTKVSVGKFVFTWTIENFSLWCNHTSEARGALMSAIFSSGVNDKSKW